MKPGSDRTLFCLADLKDDRILRNLSFGEVLAVLASRPRSADADLLFWTEEWNAWKGFDDLECLPFRAPRIETQTPPPVPLVPVLTGLETPTPSEPRQWDEVTLAPTSRRSPASLRKAERYEIQMPVIVQTTTEQFSTWTLDVSEGGIRVKDQLPDSFAGYAQVVLMPKNRAPFHLLGGMVEDQADGRYHLQFMDSPATVEFIAWMREQPWAAA